MDNDVAEPRELDDAAPGRPRLRLVRGDGELRSVDDFRPAARRRATAGDADAQDLSARERAATQWSRGCPPSDLAPEEPATRVPPDVSEDASGTLSSLSLGTTGEVLCGSELVIPGGAGVAVSSPLEKLARAQRERRWRKRGSRAAAERYGRDETIIAIVEGRPGALTAAEVASEATDLGIPMSRRTAERSLGALEAAGRVARVGRKGARVVWQPTEGRG
jgi:hypothetical protein